MACIEKIYSVSALVGAGTCNANCAFCAGKYLRKQANSNELYYKNLESAIKLSARYGGWSLSLTSSGEPTCSPNEVTYALRVYLKCAEQGAYFPNVNLFTNGILFGNDEFCDRWIPEWKRLGLTNIAVSIHSADNTRQAEVYGLSEYPSFKLIKNNIEKYGVGVRATLLLRKGEVDDDKSYFKAISALRDLGYDNITSWSVCNPDGSRNEFTPSRWGMFKIRRWLQKNTKLCHGHVWGGGVYDWRGNILRLTDYVTKHDPKKDFVRQLVVFQNGDVCYSWIKDGALCMK
jgi:hypothetical protein